MMIIMILIAIIIMIKMIINSKLLEGETITISADPHALPRAIGLHASTQQVN